MEMANEDPQLAHAGGIAATETGDDVGPRSDVVDALSSMAEEVCAAGGEAPVSDSDQSQGDACAAGGEAPVSHNDQPHGDAATPAETGQGQRKLKYPRVDPPEVEDQPGQASREDTPGYIARAFPKLFPHGAGDAAGANQQMVCRVVPPDGSAAGSDALVLSGDEGSDEDVVVSEGEAPAAAPDAAPKEPIGTYRNLLRRMDRLDRIKAYTVGGAQVAAAGVGEGTNWGTFPRAMRVCTLLGFSHWIKILQTPVPGVKIQAGVHYEIMDPLSFQPRTVINQDGTIAYPDDSLGGTGGNVITLYTHDRSWGGVPVEEKPCAEVDDISTPPTPPMSLSPHFQHDPHRWWS